MNKKYWQFKYIAFTLAEVLIVLGIIGIIADMTIPTLKRDIDKIVYVTQLKKAYSNFYQAANMTLALEGVPDVGSSSAQCQEPDSTKCTAASGTWLKTYFNIAADYGTKAPSCFAASYKTVDKKTVFRTDRELNTIYTVGLADGTCLAVQQAIAHWSKIYIDLNGLKKPNIAGKDYFEFFLYDDGSVGDVAPFRRTEDKLDELAANCVDTGYGCLTKIMINGWKMDY